MTASYKPSCQAYASDRRAYYSNCSGCMARMEKAQKEIDAKKAASQLNRKEPS